MIRYTVLLLAATSCGYFGGVGGTEGGTGPEIVPHVGDVDACSIISENSGFILEDGNFPTRPTWMGSPINWLNPTFSEAGLFIGFIWANGSSGKVVINTIDGTLTIGERAWDDGPVVWIHLDGNAEVSYTSSDGLWPDLTLDNVVQEDGSVIAWGLKPAAAVNGASAYFNTTRPVRGVSTVYGNWMAGPSISNLKSVTPTNTPMEVSFRPSLGTCAVVPAALDDGPTTSDGVDDPIGDNPLCYAIGGSACVLRDSWKTSPDGDPLTPVGSGAWATRGIEWSPPTSWLFDEPGVEGPTFMTPPDGPMLSGLEWWPEEPELLDGEMEIIAWTLGEPGCGDMSLWVTQAFQTEIEALEVPLAGAWGGMSGYAVNLGPGVQGDIINPAIADTIPILFRWDTANCWIAGYQYHGPGLGHLPLPEIGGVEVRNGNDYWVPYGGVVAFDAN